MSGESTSPSWYLRLISALAELPEPALRNLCGSAHLRQLSARAALYVPGDDAEHVYFIHGGRVSALREVARRTINVGDFGPGELVGESCLWTPDPREDMAVTASPTLLSLVPRDVLRRVLDRHPAAERTLIARFVASHQTIRRRLCDALGLGIRARLVSQLLQLGERGRDTPFGREIAYPLRQRELAALVVSTRETVSHELQRLEREGLIVRRGRQIFLDVPQLRAASRDDLTLQRVAPRVRSSLNTSIHGAPPH